MRVIKLERKSEGLHRLTIGSRIVVGLTVDELQELRRLIQKALEPTDRQVSRYLAEKHARSLGLELTPEELDALT